MMLFACDVEGSNDLIMIYGIVTRMGEIMLEKMLRECFLICLEDGEYSNICDLYVESYSHTYKRLRTKIVGKYYI